MDELTTKLNIITRHNHFGTLWKMSNTSNIGGAEVELRTITIEEWGVTSAFFLGKDVNLTLKLSVRSYAAWLTKNLTTKNLFALNTTEQATNVVASLCFVKQFAEHLNTGANSLSGFFDTNDFKFVVNMKNTALNTTSCNSTTTSNGHSILNSHQEWLVNITFWSRNEVINCFHELPDLILPFFFALKSFKSRTADDWSVISWEVVARKKLTNFHFDELEELFVVNHVALVKEYNDVRNTNLTSQEDVLTSLSHRTISSCDYENSAVHLSSTSNHVLYVVSVTWAVNVCVVTSVSFVLDVSDRNGNTTFTLFRSLIDVFKCGEVCICSTMRAII